MSLAAALAFAALVLYVVAGFFSGRALRHPAPGRIALLAGLGAVLLHAGVHAEAIARHGGVELHFFSALSWVGIGVAFVTLVVAATRPVLALGAVAFPIAAAALLLYLGFGDAGAAAATDIDWRIQLHAFLALLAYAALSVAALVALMLWFQERALRQHQLRRLLVGFPPLTLAEGLLFRLISAGFLLLTLALVTGVLFVDDLFAQHLVHKTVLSLLAWMMFGALLFGRMRFGWRGRRAVRLVLVAMLLLLLAFFGSKFVLELLLGRGS